MEDYATTIFQQPPISDVVITNITLAGTSTGITVNWSTESNVLYTVMYTTNELNAADLVRQGLGDYILAPSNSCFDTNIAPVENIYRVVVPHVWP